MRNHLISLAVAGLSLPGIALASHNDADAVAINAVSVPGCGTQSLSFSGTASFSKPVQHLAVTLDGTQLLDSHREPATWSVGPVSVGEGSHTLAATIYDETEGDGHEGIEAQDSLSFTVPGCAAAAPSGAVAGAEAAAGGEAAEEAAPVKKVVKKAPRVKAAAAERLPLKLKWINETFRKVHGRNPTFREWEHWSHRLLTDKPQYPALFGAIQWHALRGHATTTG